MSLPGNVWSDGTAALKNLPLAVSGLSALPNEKFESESRRMSWVDPEKDI